MADWMSPEQFNRTRYGKLNQQPGATNYIAGPFDPAIVPPGGEVVPDPKDGKFGIVVDRAGKAIAKVNLK